jgi:Phage tail lysozyme
VFPSETKDEDTYAYNDAGEMSEVKMLKGTETLASLAYNTRDKDGQVKTTTSKGLPGEEKPSYEYDPNNRLTKGAGIAYEYDAANNPTKIGAGAYKYNSGNELETTGARYKELVHWARSVGEHWYELNTQAEFIWHVLESHEQRGTIVALRKSKSVVEAAEAFEDGFEKAVPKDEEESKKEREELGERVYNEFG